METGRCQEKLSLPPPLLSGTCCVPGCGSCVSPAGVLGLKGNVSGGLRSVNVEDAESVGGSVMAGSEG